MEGPHGSGGAEPPETIAWLWGFLFGSMTLATLLFVLWVVGAFRVSFSA